MGAIRAGINKITLRLGDAEVERVYLGDEQIYPSGTTCTYICNGVIYQEEIEEGESCLAPTSFTPEKSGLIFLGWSSSEGSAKVLESLVMGTEPVTLYAVFKYPDAVLIQDKTYTLTPINVPYGQTGAPQTIYTIDSSKYSSHTVIASVNSFSLANNTTGYVYGEAYVDGSLIRAFCSSKSGQPTVETVQSFGGTPVGYGGAQVTLSRTGNLTASLWNRGGFWMSDATLTVHKLIGIGKTVVG
ncbi:MAG: InlB B-repeat-containing protein [Butyrivibrio sp.]|nr:InlB B-repeat-containing protein [Acetatifactor muris]MCM1561179.1 InlB B-repeat-containing protein [Butyrivibrio sp.]